MFTNILQVLRNSDDTEHLVEAALGGRFKLCKPIYQSLGDA